MSNEQPHDPTITLRLELGRVTDQRDAFKAALHKDVLSIIRYAATANDEVGCLYVELDDLRNENARLKAEVERLNDAIIAGAITPDAREVQS